MKTIIFLIILILTSSMFAQTSKFVKFFQDTSGSPVTGSTIVLIPDTSVYPNDSLALFEYPTRPGMYYRNGVPDGEYSLYIDAVFYLSKLYIGEQRLTDDINDYINKRDSLLFIMLEDGRYLENDTQTNIVALLYWASGGLNMGGTSYIDFGTDINSIFGFPNREGGSSQSLVNEGDAQWNRNLDQLEIYDGSNIHIPQDADMVQEIVENNLAKSIVTLSEPLDTLSLSNSSIIEQLTLTGDGTVFIEADSVNIKTLQVFTPGSDKTLTLKSNVTTIISPTGNASGSTGISVQVDDAWYTFTIQYKSTTEVGITWVKVGNL